MSTPALQRAWQAARRRQAAGVLLFGLPLAAVPAALAWRAGAQAAVVALLLGLLALGGVALLAARRLDQSWLIHRLDRDADLEDSSDLLFAPATRLGPLQTLQRQRLEQRLRSSPRDLRPAWPWRRAWPWSVLGVLACGALLLWPQPATHRTPPTDRVAAARASSGAPTLRQAQLRSSPPAYTGLPAARLPGLDAKVPAGTRLDWQLQVGPAPRSVAVRLTDGSTVALARQGRGDIWQGHWVAERASLYRILIDGAPADRQLHRLDVLPDRPPQVRVLAPEQSLVLWSPAARTWTLRFEASDDYAVATNAELRLTLAQGSGENITFRTQRRTLTGSGPARQRGFAITLEPHALGMAAGDDLIAQLIVHDTRQPGPQEGRSASVILRWPPPEQTMATLAACAAEIALQQGDQVGLFAVHGGGLVAVPAGAGPRQRDRLWLALHGLRAGGRWPGMTAVRPLWERIATHALVLSIGDGFDEDLNIALEKLAAARRQVMQLQVLTCDERDFGFSGGHRFRDPETGEELLGDGAAMRADYLQRFGAAQRAQQARWRAAGIAHALQYLDAAPDAALRQLFGQGAQR